MKIYLSIKIFRKSNKKKISYKFFNKFVEKVMCNMKIFNND